MLLDKLKALRAKLASVQGVPAYLIFTDTSLRDMCERLPRTDSEFLNVSGVGAAKLERYGNAFITVIKEYAEKNQVAAVTEEKEIKKLRRNMMKTAEDIREAFDGISAGIGKVTLGNESLSLSAFSEKIITETDMHMATAPLRKSITGWLRQSGLLTQESESRAADMGEEIGIYNLNVTSPQTGKQYIKVLYKPSAQQFILDNISAVGEFAVESFMSKSK